MIDIHLAVLTAETGLALTADRKAPSLGLQSPIENIRGLTTVSSASTGDAAHCRVKTHISLTGSKAPMLPGLTTASQCCTQVDQATPWAPASVGRGRGASAVVSVGLFALPTPMNRTMNGEVAANKLAGTPGSTWQYSNIGYTVSRADRGARRRR